MNKVKQRAASENSAKFLYASRKMYLELKIIKFVLYFLNVIPVIICFLPTSEVNVKVICSLVSFALTLTSEVSSQLISDYKERTIMVSQIYEAEITGSTFSKIEYDRESTNDMQELAIRKGMPLISKGKKIDPPNVPEEISDDYSYLYICRQNAAKTRFILSREAYFYLIFLALIAAAFVTATSLATELTFSFYYIICLWPLIVPLIRNYVSCQKCMKQCVKICADIDNFFADGDESVERLARFYYYVQNLEFEMLLQKPIIFKFIEKLNVKPLRTLAGGVTVRFKDAINDLKKSKYITAPKGKSLITKVDYDLDELKEKERLAKQRKKEEEEKANHRKPESVMLKETESVELKSKTKTKSSKPQPKKNVEAKAKKPAAKPKTSGGSKSKSKKK